MHHFAAKGNLVIDSGSETNKLGSRGNEQPLCPKPRRLGPSMPEFLKPPRCSKHRLDFTVSNLLCFVASQLNPDGRKDILNIISEKNTDGREALCNGCTPSCYSGSPPGRTDNPLVQDVQFIHQMELLSPFTQAKLSDKFGFTSA